ncbi:hypothetical protein DFH07DRAFT_859033 [Mycena maculata]|uniref:Uncharacterized protein n=1 Tax=Mycena maculata TaxID=230809 RepID=A0AAD7HG38_9AGAR|nr:hypothetical protein DFH07DRAFT_862446 [Mycena maculata]KAJ7720008.1 hypothetical protein DFH07DRAFT_859033 [Mycena maculata]
MSTSTTPRTAYNILWDPSAPLYNFEDDIEVYPAGLFLPPSDLPRAPQWLPFSLELQGYTLQQGEEISILFLDCPPIARLVGIACLPARLVRVHPEYIASLFHASQPAFDTYVLARKAKLTPNSDTLRRVVSTLQYAVNSLSEELRTSASAEFFALFTDLPAPEENLAPLAFNFRRNNCTSDSQHCGFYLDEQDHGFFRVLDHREVRNFGPLLLRDGIPDITDRRQFYATIRLARPFLVAFRAGLPQSGYSPSETVTAWFRSLNWLHALLPRAKQDLLDLALYEPLPSVYRSSIPRDFTIPFSDFVAPPEVPFPELVPSTVSRAVTPQANVVPAGHTSPVRAIPGSLSFTPPHRSPVVGPPTGTPFGNVTGWNLVPSVCSTPVHSPRVLQDIDQSPGHTPAPPDLDLVPETEVVGEPERSDAGHISPPPANPGRKPPLRKTPAPESMVTVPPSLPKAGLAKRAQSSRKGGPKAPSQRGRPIITQHSSAPSISVVPSDGSESSSDSAPLRRRYQLRKRKPSPAPAPAKPPKSKKPKRSPAQPSSGEKSDAPAAPKPKVKARRRTGRPVLRAPGTEFQSAPQKPVDFVSLLECVQPSSLLQNHGCNNCGLINRKCEPAERIGDNRRGTHLIVCPDTRDFPATLLSCKSIPLCATTMPSNVCMRPLLTPRLDWSSLLTNSQPLLPITIRHLGLKRPRRCTASLKTCAILRWPLPLRPTWMRFYLLALRSTGLDCPKKIVKGGRRSSTQRLPRSQHGTMMILLTRTSLVLLIHRRLVDPTFLGRSKTPPLDSL